MDVIGLIVISIAVGLLVGILSGMLGIGGGTILVPVFKLGYGLPAIACTATSLFTIIPTSLSGALAHIKGKTCIPRFGIAAGVGGAITSPVGVWLANLSPDWAIMLAAALVIAYSSITMLRKGYLAWKAQKQTKQRTDSEADAALTEKSASAALTEEMDPASYISWKNVAVCAILGLVAGVLSGYVGVGGGFLMTPLMMQIIGMPMKLTSGTTLVAMVILATAGTITQAIMGNVQWTAGIAVAIGAIPGALIGAHLMKHVSEVALRFIFGIFLLIMAIMLIVF